MPVPRRSSTLPLLALLVGLAGLPPAAAAEASAIAFTAGLTVPDAEARGTLDVLAKRLSADKKLKLRLIAYAGPAAPSTDDRDASRRLALARARAAWLHLTGAGVSSDRITVLVQGEPAATGAPDRIDLFVEQP